MIYSIVCWWVQHYSSINFRDWWPDKSKSVIYGTICLFKYNQIVHITCSIIYLWKILHFSVYRLVCSTVWVGLGPSDAGSGWVGSEKVNPRPCVTFTKVQLQSTGRLYQYHVWRIICIKYWDKKRRKENWLRTVQHAAPRNSLSHI